VVWRAHQALSVPEGLAPEARHWYRWETGRRDVDHGVAECIHLYMQTLILWDRGRSIRTPVSSNGLLLVLGL
jgi:hypothetical protein